MALIAPVIVPDPTESTDPEFKVILVASILLEPRVKVLVAATVTEAKELDEVPKLPAKVLSSLTLTVPTPSEVPVTGPVIDPAPTFKIPPEPMVTESEKMALVVLKVFVPMEIELSAKELAP